MLLIEIKIFGKAENVNMLLSFASFQFPVGFGVNVYVLPIILASGHQRLQRPSALSASLMIKASRLLYMLLTAVNTFLC